MDKLEEGVSETIEVEMETKRMTGISNLLEASRINLKKTEKKTISRSYYLDSNNI